MAGKCVLCNNLNKKEMVYEGKPIECYRCSVGKYDGQDKLEWFYSLNSVLKPCKSVKDIEEECDSWDDRLKPKRT